MATTSRRALLRPFHQASWNEPIILEQTSPGERGIVPPETEREIAETVGDGVSAIPEALRRKSPPGLPELSQPQVLRHYLRLSQETLGNDVNIHLGLGTCTMKYSPKVNEALVRAPSVAALHPFQNDETVQGLLEAMHLFERVLCEISGMDRFTFQPASGTQGVYANARMIKAFHASRGEDERDEIVTTIFSHPCDAASPATAGLKIVTLYPGPKGYPELDAVKAAVSERTAGLMITNPEDTGIFNPLIDEFVEVVHDAGGLCHYDQANANGILGVTRARDAGFDLCQFNLHKTFSSPHSSMGMPVGACGVTEALAPFLPAPTVEFDGARYSLDYDRPQSIGKVRAFHGVPATVVRALAWALSLGADGLREVAEVAVLNNNYLAKQLEDVRGIDVSLRRREYDASARADPLLARAPEGGDGRRHARRGAPHRRFRRLDVLPEPRAVARRGADDARALGVVFEGRSRHLRGNPAPDLGGGVLRSRRRALVTASQHGPQARGRHAERPGALGAHLAGVPA